MHGKEMPAQGQLPTCGLERGGAVSASAYLGGLLITPCRLFSGMSHALTVSDLNSESQIDMVQESELRLGSNWRIAPFSLFTETALGKVPRTMSTRVREHVLDKEQLGRGDEGLYSSENLQVAVLSLVTGHRFFWGAGKGDR